MSNMADICRCCLKSADMLVDIFAQRHEDEPSLAAMLRECGDCEVQSDDALPKQLCLDCVLATQSEFRLKRSLINSDSGVYMEAAEEYGLLEDSDIDILSLNLEPTVSMPTVAIISEEDNQENRAPTPDDSEAVTQIQRYPTRIRKRKCYISEEHYSSDEPFASNEDGSSVELSSVDSSSDTEASPSNNKKSRLHNKERPCKCPYPRCTADFRSNKGLNAHMRRHGKRTYTCDSCPKAFIRKYDLDVHMRTHTGERPFKCPHCPQSFTWNNVLKLHIRTHTGERPFKCASCPKTFATRHSLKEHSRVHTNECTFACPHCSQSFKYNKTLRRHVLRHMKDAPKRQNLKKAAKTKKTSTNKIA